MGLLEEVYSLNSDLVDLDFGDILTSEDYTKEAVLPNDNLMSLSYRHFDSIDLWWTIYYFNNIKFVETAFIDSSKQKKYMKRLQTQLLNVDGIDKLDKAKLEEVFRQAYINIGYDTVSAIAKAKQTLITKVVDEEVRATIETTILDNISITDTVKIPSTQLVVKMQQVLLAYKKRSKK